MRPSAPGRRHDGRGALGHNRAVALPEPIPTPAAAPSRPRLTRLGHESDAVLSVFLVLLLAGTIVGWPLHETGAGWIVTVLRLLTLVVGVAAVAPHRVHVAIAALAAALVAYQQLASSDGAPVLLVARAVFFGVVAAALLVRAFRPGRITVHRILGAVSVYVLLAVIWGTAYQLLAVLRPDAVRGPAGPATLDEAMWLSFITITTTGYGDVLPASHLARSLAALEAMVGVLYPAILISRLVSLVQGPSSQPPPSTAT